MKKKVQLLLLLVALSATTLLNAKTFIANDFASYVAAINAVNSGSGGDTIKITGDILATGQAISNINKDVTLTGEINSNGSPKYTIEGDNVNAAPIYLSSKNCTVENLIATGGAMGGIIITTPTDSSAVVKVNNCIASNNAGFGLEIMAIVGKATVSNCTFNDNAISGAMVMALTTVMENCIANNNQKSDGFTLLDIGYATAYVTNCTAMSNAGDGFNVTAISIVINNCSATGNAGRGLYIDAGNGRSIISNSTAANNKYGIRIADNSFSKIINCTAYGNSEYGIGEAYSTGKSNNKEVYNSIAYRNQVTDLYDGYNYAEWSVYNTVCGNAKTDYYELQNKLNCRSDDPKLLGRTAAGAATNDPKETAYYTLDNGSSASGLADRSLISVKMLSDFISTGLTPELTAWFKSIVTNDYIFNLLAYDQTGNVRSFDGNTYDAGSITASIGKMVNPKYFFTYTPQKVANYGEGSMIFYGKGFDGNVNISLKKQGESDIVADNIESAYSSEYATYKCTSKFNFDKKSVGKWDLVVDFGDTIVTVKNGLELESYIEPEVDIDLVGANSIRPGAWTNYTIKYQNMGNVDIYNVPIIIEIITDKQAVVSIKEGWDYSIPDGLDTTHFNRIDTLIDPFNGKLHTYIAPNIRYIAANGTGYLSFAVNFQNVSNAIEVSAEAFDPMFILNSNAYQAAEGVDMRAANGLCNLVTNPNSPNCLQTSADLGAKIGMSIAGALIPGFSCFSSALTVGCNTIQNNYSSNPGNVAWDLAGMGVNCITSFVPGLQVLKTAWTVVKVMKSGYDWYNKAPGSEKGCGGKGKKSPGKLVGSIDPNDKTGPVSESGSTWFSDRKDFPYVINFENKSTATAPAQEIVITDTLDLNVFDITTFEAGFIKIGSRLIEAPVHIQNFTWTIDMPEKRLVTTIDLQLDKVKGIATWHFTCIDPKTGAVPADALAGFLPPNDDNGSGQGSVVYSIQLKDGLADNVVVANKASIVFDNNEPILTPTWVNQKDVVAPTSQMTEATDAGAGKVNLKWQGTDNAGGSGVYSYDVYAKQGAGDYLLIAGATTETTAQYQTDGISEYAFYTIATDNAGNREFKANVPDLTFTDIKVVTPESENMFLLSPNPARTECTVTLDVERQGNMKITLLNLLGAKVMKIYDGSVEAGRFTQTFSTGSLPTGVYTVIVYTADNKIRAEKLLIVR